MTENNTANHICDPKGIPTSDVTGTWDWIETENVPGRMAYTASSMVLNPLMLIQGWMMNQAMTLAQEYLPDEKKKEFYWYTRWAVDLQTDIEMEMCRISAAVTQNLPSKLGVLTEMLDKAIADSGYCCNTRVDEYLRGVVTEHYIAEMAQTIPCFNPEWLTQQGAKDHRATLIAPGGPKD